MTLQTYANKIDPITSLKSERNQNTINTNEYIKKRSIFFAQILNFFLSSNFAASDK